MSQDSHELSQGLSRPYEHIQEITGPYTHEQSYQHDHIHEKAANVYPHEGHKHRHTQSKVVLNRLSRIIGHLESVKRMVESGRDCSEVLVQLAAVGSAVKSVSRVVMKDHIEHCIVDAVKNNDTETLKKLNEAIDRCIK